MEKKNKLPKLGYHTDEVLTVFKLKRKLGGERLTNWLSNPSNIPAEWSSAIENSRRKLMAQGSEWNEEELKMHFLSTLFNSVDFYKEDSYNLFYERPLSQELNGYTLSVVCDSLVAKLIGTNTPDQPYFFLQEFKQEKGKYADAEAQMLQAMLIAQAKNTEHKPIYGCFLQGRFWAFAILEGRDYMVSKFYDATETDDLQIIVSALKRLKTYIEAELAI